MGPRERPLLANSCFDPFFLFGQFLFFLQFSSHPPTHRPTTPLHPHTPPHPTPPHLTPVGDPRGGGPEGEAGRRVGPERGVPKISHFFPSPSTIFILSSLSWGLLVSFFLSLWGSSCRSVSHVDRGWWASCFGPVLLSWMGVVFGPLLDILNLFLCLL